MVDPHTAEEGYNNCAGYRTDGLPWPDPTQGNSPTSFPFYGDPVLGTGWLASHMSVPKDMRFGLSSGPFDLAVGESQDIVVGLMVGEGEGNLMSLVDLRWVDQMAQAAYDRNFKIPTIGAPAAQAVPFDKSVILTWGDASSSVSDNAYAFEGYNVWQGESENGPWVRLATFDVVNGIEGIWDATYDPLSGETLEHVVAHGTDSGIQYQMHVERDTLRNVPFVNGREYWFAVTAYAFDSDGVPRVIENVPQALKAVPQRPVMDTKLQSAHGDTIAVVHEGPSSGQVLVNVIDPWALTGHDYRVSFTALAAGTDSEEVVWKLTDVTTGEDVLTDQTHQTLDGDFRVVDGMQVKVESPSGGIMDIVQVDGEGNVLDDNLRSSLNSSADRTAGKCAFYCHVAGSDDNTWMARLNWDNAIASEDYEIRFVDDPATSGDLALSAWLAAPPYTMNGYQSGPVGAVAVDATYTPEYAGTGGRMPFQVWMIDADGTEIHVVSLILEDTELGNWDLSGTQLGPNSPEGYNYERLYGSKIPYEEAAILADGGADVVDSQFWGMRPNNSAFSRLVISMYYDNYDSAPSGNFFTEPPAPGTIIRIRTNKPNSEEDTFSFSTAGYEPLRSAAVAKAKLDEINVFPNPYLGHNRAEKEMYEQFMTFSNLPGECVIRVFSISGQLVRVLEHNNGTPYERWDLLNTEGLPVASAMYIVHVRTEYGDRILKLGVINRAE